MGGDGAGEEARDAPASFEPAAFAYEFQRFVTGFNRLVPPRTSPLRDLIVEHLGADPARLPVLSQGLDSAEHPNLQLAMNELVSGHGWRAVGLSLGLRQFGAFSLGALMTDRMAEWGMPPPRPVPVEYVSVPIGPDEALDCVQLALFVGTWRGVPLVVLVMAGDERSHFQVQLTVEVLALEREAGRDLLSELARRRAALNVYRGQTLSFGFTQHGGFRLQFLRLPGVDRAQLILPDADLAAIEAHTLGIARRADALRAARRHLKRGLLLYGPPGTGKTWSIAYLRSRMADRTTVVLNGGPGLHQTLGQAVALARDLQPAMVVLEDVDLIAHERTHGDWDTNPLLFQLLNEMDGLAEDADVVFVLTTNRLELLEPALAMRPGRIDQAVEIRLPDADCRRRLFELYLRDVPPPADGIELEPLVAATEGASAAFVKELVRRSVLLAALEADAGPEVDAGDDDGRPELGAPAAAAPTVEARHLSDALAALAHSQAPVLRTLLGAAPTE
jgi:ATPase family associated with various cellular activities (AAA)